MAAKSEPKVPNPVVDFHRQPIGETDDWVRFEGQMDVGDYIMLMRADGAGDMEKVITLVSPFVKEWSFDGDHSDIDPETKDSWGGFSFGRYMGVVTAFNTYLNQSASQGN